MCCKVGPAPVLLQVCLHKLRIFPEPVVHRPALRVAHARPRL